eukprot:maker-scaffold363_size195477-snap-gene-0.44 protein:Tk06642 transcript:maker-scaffold363_size195477-snap-gene-0.44-mRNA-1 annotation:"briggsae cbr-ppk-3 protein"
MSMRDWVNEKLGFQTPSHWMPDAVSIECYECGTKFTTFRRKHHCRVCGQIFCAKCCAHTISGHVVGCKGSLRVCVFCNQFFQGALGTDARALPPRDGAAGRTSGGSSASQGGTEQAEGAGAQASDFLLHHPKQLEVLAEQMSTSPTLEGGTRILDGRAYFACVTGQEIVDWLQNRDPTLDGIQVVAIGHALKAMDFLVPMVSGSSLHFATDCLYKIAPANAHSDGGESAGLGESSPSELLSPDWLQSLDDTMTRGDRARETAESSPDLIQAQETFGSKKGLLALQGNAPPPVELLWNTLPSTLQPDGSLHAVYTEFVEALVQRVVEQEALDPVWIDLLPAAVMGIVNSIELDHKYRGDVMDIRKFVKVKKLPAQVCSMSVIHGVSFTNNITRKGMPRKLVNPKVLLVRGSIAFQRNEERMVSLEKLDLLETEYVRKITATIITLGPQLVLVEQSISKPAQDILHQHKMAIVVNVKIHVLQRLARMFDMTIHSFSGTFLPSQAVPMETCAQFLATKYEFPDGRSKTLVHIEGSPPELGCSVLIRGPQAQMKVVKKVLRRLLLILRNARCENALLSNQEANLDAWSRPAVGEVHLNSLLSPLLLHAKGLHHTEPLSESHGGPRPLEPVFRSPELAANSSWASFERETAPLALPKLCTSAITEDPRSNAVSGLLADFRANIGQFQVLPRSNEAATRSPAGMKEATPKNTTKGNARSEKAPLRSFPVLFSSYSPTSRAAPYYCVLPWIVHMQIYGINDVTVGTFLDTFCFSETYTCPNKICDTPMKNHVRRFCHSSGCVTMCIQDIDIHLSSTAESQTSEHDTIFMWKFCPLCQKVSTLRPLGDLASQYSFAMFLLLLFHSSDLTRGEGCGHALNRGQLTCFSLGRSLVSFRYDPIQPFALSLPAIRLQAPTKSFSQAKLAKDIQYLSLFGTSVYNNMFEDILALEASTVVVTSNEKRSSDLPTELRDLYDDQHGSYRELQRTINAHWEGGELQVCHHLLFKAEKFILDGIDKWEKLQARGKSPSTRKFEIIPNPGAGVPAEASEESSKENDSLKSAGDPSRFMYPPQAHHHYSISPTQEFLVNEKEPSSLIAYALKSKEYASYLTNDPPVVEQGSDFHLQFEDTTCRFYCCAYFARQFANIRVTLFGDSSDDKFIQSLCESMAWEAKGGKSGLNFYKTKDDRFILKQMSRFEFQSFQSLAPNYFEYLTQKLDSSRPATLLAKIVGVYRLGFKNNVTGASMKLDILVIENLFQGCVISESYDLKGSIRNRMAETSGQKADSSLVLLDENLLKVACERPLYISWSSKESLLQAIDVDTSFLAGHSIMDYSLLVGIDSKNNTLVLGIIDYVRAFTWDKKIETLVKSSGFLGGAGKTPTVISPNLYKRRFTEAMYKYFILVPDLSFRDPEELQHNALESEEAKSRHRSGSVTNGSK